MEKRTSKETPESHPSPAGLYKHTTTEELIAMFPVHEEGKQVNKCLVYTLAGFVTLFAVWTVFASIALRVMRDPEIKLGSAPRVMHFTYNNASASDPLNVTMIARVIITNRNLGRFDYRNSIVSVLYGSTCVGAGKIGGAVVGVRETKEINVMVNIIGGNFTMKDIHSGIVKLRSYAELSGTVHLLKIVKKRKTIVMACIMNLNLTSHSFHHFQC